MRDMTKMIIFFSFIILNSSCGNNRSRNSDISDSLLINSESVLSADNIENKTLKLEGDDIRISKVALSFYDWYFKYKEDYDSSIVLNIAKDTNNNCTLKNLDNYINSLKSIGTLTERFVDNEYKRLLECKEYLNGYNWDKYKTSTFYEVTDNTPCETAFSYWLFNSQESAQAFDIVDYQRKDSVVVVIINFYFIDDVGRHMQYFESVERLIAINNKWFIDEIIPRRKK